MKKTSKDVSLHDPIGTDKEGNEITLIDILGSEADDVIKEVDLKIEKSKIYHNMDVFLTEVQMISFYPTRGINSRVLTFF